ncbi:MAG: hypothetical protein FJ387_15830 [Verrucomicrobia bacterium]|nr:hypothetical protein [Verrucomicrobiota bacterium]
MTTTPPLPPDTPPAPTGDGAQQGPEPVPRRRGRRRGLTSEQSEALKSDILRRHHAGEIGSDIARAVGVSRQYVHALLKQIQREGEAVTLAKRRGRLRDKPLTPSEVVALRAHIKASQDPVGNPLPTLTGKAVTAWFKRTFGRTLPICQLRRFCTEDGLKLALVPNADRYAEGERVATLPSVVEPSGAAPVVQAPVVQAPVFEAPEIGALSAERKRGRPRKDAPRFDPEELTPEVLAAMEQSNQEVRRRMAEQAPSPQPTAPVRLPAPKLGRNDPCPYDPGKKFKRCCGAQGAKWCLRQAAETEASSAGAAPRDAADSEPPSRGSESEEDPKT